MATIIGGNVIECVNTYGILGVVPDKYLKWNSHVEYIIKVPMERNAFHIFVKRTL